MTLTVRAARETVLEHLDDESGERFARATGSNTESFTKIDRALRSAQSRCLDDYIAAGGDRFDEQVDVTTEDDGTVSLAGYDNPSIRGVMVVPDSDGSMYPIEPGDKMSRLDPDDVERDLKVTLVRRFTIPDPVDEDDLLMGQTAGVARSWDAFDHWVCARAAIQLGIKDDELRRALVATADDLKASVLGQRRTPSYLPWPTAGLRRQRSFSRDLRWTWLQREQTLVLFYGVA